MLTAKVVDNIWSTRKTDLLNGYKLMLVEVIGGKDDGQRQVAVDNVGAGIGERVLVALGSSARRSPGEFASAMAIAILCCSPPESVCSLELRWSAIPTASRSSSARCFFFF